MIVLFVPKTLPFDWEHPAFSYLPFKFSVPFLAADGVRVLDPTSTQGVEFLQSVYYMILNETEYTRSYKFYLNVQPLWLPDSYCIYKVFFYFIKD